jgi:TolB protein
MKPQISILLTVGAMIGFAGGCSDLAGPIPLGTADTPPTRVADTSGSGPYHIYVANSSGGDSRRLARGFWPAWSPDGSKIAYQDGTERISVIERDGTDARQLTTGLLPRWSPDGARIAYLRFTPNDDNGPFPIGDQTFRVINVDGSGEITLVQTKTSGTIPPAEWSPDGKKIAFIGGEDNHNDLHVVNVDGSGMTRITQLGTVKTGADWSPDGRKLAFGAAGSVYVVNADGSDLTELTRDPGALVVRSVVYSPSGDRIAFSLSLDPNVWETKDGDSLTIHVINADGTNRTSVATHATDPRWLGDGRTLSFGRWFVDEIWTVSADGGEPALLVDGLEAAWSPDGTRLAYVRSH